MKIFRVIAILFMLTVLVIGTPILVNASPYDFVYPIAWVEPKEISSSVSIDKVQINKTVIIEIECTCKNGEKISCTQIPEAGNVIDMGSINNERFKKMKVKIHWTLDQCASTGIAMELPILFEFDGLGLKLLE